MDPVVYVNFLLVLFRVLTIIPLTFFLRKFINLRYSMVVSTAIILTAPLYYEPAVGYYYYTFGSLFGLLFACFILKLYEDKTLLSSLLFALLITTHPVAFLLIPSVFYWFYINHKHMREYLKFLILPSLLPMIWFVRNGMVHGFTINGIFGGYHGFRYLNYIQPGFIPSKIHYMLTFGTRITFVSWFFITLILIFPVLTYFLPSNRLKKIMKTFTLNLFILLPTIFYYKTVEPTWKYIALLSPVYITLFFISCIILFKPVLKKHFHIHRSVNKKSILVNGFVYSSIVFIAMFIFLYYFFGFTTNVWDWSFSLTLSGFLMLLNVFLYYGYHSSGGF